MKGVQNVPADYFSQYPSGCDECAVDEVEDELTRFLNFIEAETRSRMDRKQIVIESRRVKLLSRVAE